MGLRVLFNILDYSVLAYKKLFWKFTLISLLVNLPYIFLNKFVAKYFEDINEITPGIAVLYMVIFALNLMFYFFISPILSAYINMKTFVFYTDSVCKGIYKLNFTLKGFIKKIPALLFYNVVVFCLIMLSIIGFVPAIYLLTYYIGGYEGLNIVFSFMESPMEIDFAAGLINFFISIIGTLWLGYFLARFMFGMQAIFIENYQGVKSLIRSHYLTRNQVKLVSYVIIIATFFVFWTGTILYMWQLGFKLYNSQPIDFQGLDATKIINSFFSLPVTIVFAVTSVFINIVMTVTYIYLKIKGDAFALEFKMLKLMGKQQPVNNDMVTFMPEKIHGENNALLRGLEKGGIISRFWAYLIDFLISSVLFTVITVVIWMNSAYFVEVLMYWFSGLTGSENILFTIFISIIFAYVFFNVLYMTVAEIFLKGQTPGKKIVGITVVDKNGLKPNFKNIILRNIFRIIDFIPFSFLVGFITAILNRNEQRVGDMISKTYVVKIFTNYKSDKVNYYNLGNNLPPVKNIYPVSSTEMQVLTEFLEFKDLTPERKAFFAYNLNIYFSLKFDVKSKYNNPYDFFRDIVSMNK
jgi:uncharacterized RDD family membrane protein YckC